jgi:hypothetical protein
MTMVSRTTLWPLSHILNFPYNDGNGDIFAGIGVIVSRDIECGGCTATNNIYETADNKSASRGL